MAEVLTNLFDVQMTDDGEVIHEAYVTYHGEDTEDKFDLSTEEGRKAFADDIWGRLQDRVRFLTEK